MSARFSKTPDKIRGRTQDCHSASVPQVGAVVEVKNPDGVYQEATINKLTDASIYTVGESTSKDPKSCRVCTSDIHAR